MGSMLSHLGTCLLSLGKTCRKSSAPPAPLGRSLRISFLDFYPTRPSAVPPSGPPAGRARVEWRPPRRALARWRSGQRERRSSEKVEVGAHVRPTRTSAGSLARAFSEAPILFLCRCVRRGLPHCARGASGGEGESKRKGCATTRCRARALALGLKRSDRHTAGPLLCFCFQCKSRRCSRRCARRSRRWSARIGSTRRKTRRSRCGSTSSFNGTGCAHCIIDRLRNFPRPHRVDRFPGACKQRWLGQR